MTTETPQILGYNNGKELYLDSRTLVYQAIRESDAQAVVIKILREEYPTFEELARLCNQYTITRHLDIDGIIKPYKLEPYKNGYALVMEDFEGLTLAEFIHTETCSIEQFLTIAVQIAKTFDSRGRAKLISILGDSYLGVLSSDDYSAYNGYNVKDQQKCCAHLRRHFKRLLTTPGLHNKEIGQKFIDLIDEAFRQYKAFQQNHNLEEFANWASQFKLQVEAAIQTWIGKAGGTAGILLRSLRDKAHQWWYFLQHPEIPPDNNLAERTLRLAVTKRKVSGGSRSMERFKHCQFINSYSNLSISRAFCHRIFRASY